MILDLFAGPGGWDEGLRLLGNTDPLLGIEHDTNTCRVAVAAGHARMQNDVRTVDTALFSPLSGLIASPPCQTFSLASKSASDGEFKSRKSLPRLVMALDAVMRGHAPASAAAVNGLDTEDPRSTLVLEPMRFIRQLAPVWVAMENVPGVLPVWRAYETLLPRLGYSTWAGTLNAADYGLPQARRRAFFLASKRGTVRPPEPTHQKKEGGPLPQWVTMAEALDLGERPDDLTQWAWDRPATTVVRSFLPEVISAPGYRRKGDPPRQRTPGSITVTHAQMAVLQGLRPDFPYDVAPVSKRGSMIGAALPPTWASHLLRPLLDQDEEPMTCEECGNDDAAYGFAFCSDCLDESGATL